MLLDKERRGIPYQLSGTEPRWTEEPQWQQLRDLAKVAKLQAAVRVDAAKKTAEETAMAAMAAKATRVDAEGTLAAKVEAVEKTKETAEETAKDAKAAKATRVDAVKALADRVEAVERTTAEETAFKDGTTAKATKAAKEELARLKDASKVAENAKAEADTKVTAAAEKAAKADKAKAEAEAEASAATEAEKAATAAAEKAVKVDKAAAKAKAEASAATEAEKAAAAAETAATAAARDGSHYAVQPKHYSLRSACVGRFPRAGLQLSHACLHCAQGGIEDLSWTRIMELCCSHLDLVEVRCLATTPHPPTLRTLPTTLLTCRGASPDNAGVRRDASAEKRLYRRVGRDAR